MAHFRGYVSGRSRTEASRLATKASGLRVVAQSWQGDIKVTLWHNESTGRDSYLVESVAHGSTRGVVLSEGELGIAPDGLRLS